MEFRRPVTPRMKDALLVLQEAQTEKNNNNAEAMIIAIPYGVVLPENLMFDVLKLSSTLFNSFESFKLHTQYKK